MAAAHDSLLQAIELAGARALRSGTNRHPRTHVGPRPVGRLWSGLDRGAGNLPPRAKMAQPRPDRLLLHATGFKLFPEGPTSDNKPFPDGIHLNLYITCNFF